MTGYGVLRNVFFLQNVEKEKERFKSAEVAERYLRLYGTCDKLLAELGIGKNAPRYWAAKECKKDKIILDYQI